MFLAIDVALPHNLSLMQNLSFYHKFSVEMKLFATFASRRVQNIFIFCQNVKEYFHQFCEIFSNVKRSTMFHKPLWLLTTILLLKLRPAICISFALILPILYFKFVLLFLTRFVLIILVCDSVKFY